MRLTEILERLSRRLDGLVHVCVAEPAAAARHRAFLAVHLGIGLAALAALPLWLAAGAPAAERAPAALLLLVAAPLAAAALLSTTGRLDRAQLASAATLALFTVWLARNTGGLASPALVWLVLLPIRAALVGSRRVAALAAGIGAIGLAALAIEDVLATAPAAPPALSLQIALAAAAFGHAGLLAFGILARGRAARAAAAEAEARYRLIAEGLEDRLVTLHARNGAVLHASSAARTLLGVPPAQLAEAGLLAHVHVADRPAFLTALSEADRTGDTVRAGVRLRTAAGDVFEAELSARPMRDTAGAPGVAAVLRPVAAERLAETARAETERRLAAAETERSAFLATLGHELRTPLNAILGFAELLEEGRDASSARARQSDYAALIRISGAHLLEIVDGFLDLGRLEAGETEIVPEPVALTAVVEAARAMIGHQARQRGVTLRLDLAPGLPEVHADRAACRRIVLNLLSNAVKFSRPGGVILVSAAAEGGHVVLTVADRGIGIAAADLPRLGAPFVRLAPTGPDAAEGSGLGLSIVRRLAALMGGAMTIDSALGRGTTVRVTLPRAPDDGRTSFPERVERRA
nr:PAS domain-containing sensor histidine kinase [Prosthecomicrobium pneumaticum]